MSELTIEVGTGDVVALPVPPTSADQILLGSDCRLVGWSLRDTSVPTPGQNEGSVVSPAAGAAIVTVSGLRAGTYDVVWSVALQGAPGAGDADNFQIKNGATVVENAINAGAAGTYPQTPVRITVAANGTLTVNAIAAGTVGVTYLASVELIPTLVGTTVIEIQDTGNILGEVSLTPNEAKTSVLDHDGVVCQGQIKLHVVSGSVTGVVFARLSR